MLIWPHRLDDHSRDVYQDIADGEIPEFVVHVCVGINGFATMEDPDPDLVHAAFSTIFPNNELLRDEIRASFGGALERTKDVSYDERELAVQRAMGELVVASPVIREVICESLDQQRDELGLIVPDCRVLQSLPESS